MASTLNTTRRYPVAQRVPAYLARSYADQATPPLAQLTKEMGIPGGPVEGGLSLQSYNPDLSGPEWFRKVDEMLLASSQAAVIELCVTLPIISAEWIVKGGSAENRKLIETSLFGSLGMSTTWTEVLTNACGSALYGLTPFEIVWKETPEGLLVRRLMDRDPASITEWDWDSDGGLAKVKQEGTDPDSEKDVEVWIPIEKMLLFVHRLRRRQYHGRSILRPAFRHYESIRMLCAFADIGLDHSLVGVPVGKAPAGAKPADIGTFRDLLSSIRRHEASGLVMPAGWDVVDGAKLGGSDSVGFLDYVQWHEGCFLRSALCSFMQLGSTPTGTTELGGDLMDFSIMSWMSLAGNVKGIFNRHLIRRTCDYNAGRPLNEADYPELDHQAIGEVFGQRQQAGQFLGAVANGQEVLPEDPEQRTQAMRDGLGLPDGDPRKEGAPVGKAFAAGKGRPQGAPVRAGLVPAPGEKAFAEQDVQAAVARVKADGAAARDGWQQQMAPRVEALLNNLLRQVDLAAADEARLAEITPAPALVDDLANGIATFIAGVRSLAAQRMADETGVDPDPEMVAGDPQPAEMAKAWNVAAHLAESTRFAVVGGALRGEDLSQLASAFAEQVDVRLRNDLRAAAQGAVAAVNEG